MLVHILYITHELNVILAQYPTFHIELSDLHTCSSACPVLCAGRRCLSGLVTERPAAARFPVWRFNEGLEQFYTAFM